MRFDSMVFRFYVNIMTSSHLLYGWAGVLISKCNASRSFEISANEPLFVEMNFYISYRIEKQSVRRRSDFAALRNVLELTQNMRKPSYWSCPSNKKILVAASCSRAQTEYEELNHIDQWNEITANDNSNEEKSTIKVILVAARNVMKPLSGLQLLLHWTWHLRVPSHR